MKGAGYIVAVDELEARMRELVHEELGRPEYVTQRTVQAVTGMPSRDYLRHCRDGAWPVRSDRRLRYAKTAVVLAWIEAQRGNEALAGEFQRSRSRLSRVA